MHIPRESPPELGDGPGLGLHHLSHFCIPQCWAETWGYQMTDSCSWLTLQQGKDDMEGHKGVKQFSWPWHICKFVHTGPCLGDHLVVPEKTISSSECWASRQTDSLLLSQSESRSASPQGGEASTHLVANHSLTWLSTILSRAANRTPPCLLMQATALQLLVQTNTCFPCVKEYEVLEDKNTAFIPRKFMCRTSVGGHTSSTTLSRQVPPQPVRDAVMNTIKWQVTRHSIAVDDLDDLSWVGMTDTVCFLWKVLNLCRDEIYFFLGG